ncbi:MAG: MBL fold metallo-hydrolase [Candidatus Nezhaarchaeales archaeon]
MISRFGEPVKVLDGVYCIPSLAFDSNVYVLLGSHGFIMVDSGLGLNTKSIINALGKLGLRVEDLRVLINTHCHIDHTGGNREILSLSGAKLALHEEDAKFLEDGEASAVEPLGILDVSLKPLKVDFKLKEDSVLNLGVRTLRVIHTPGHTPGSLCLFDEANKVLISGDTVFLDGVGRYDLPYSSYQDLLRSVEKLTKLDVNTLLPGHGPYTVKGGKQCVVRDLKLLKTFGPL